VREIIEVFRPVFGMIFSRAKFFKKRKKWDKPTCEVYKKSARTIPNFI